MAGPSTAREALLAEVYGDLLGLVERVEALKASMPGLTDQLAAEIAEASRLASVQIATSGKQSVQNVAQIATHTLEGMTRERAALQALAEQHVREARAAAQLVGASANRLALYATGIGMGAGAIGGVLATLAFGKLF